MGEHRLPRSPILGADGRAAWRAPAAQEVLPPEPEPLNARVPKAARVGYNEGMVWIVFDPGLPTAVAFGLNREAAIALGQDLASAGGDKGAEPEVL